MIRRVEWSNEARDDFDKTMEYIAFDNEYAARLVATRILEAIDRLEEFPTGRIGRVAGTYEKLVQKTPYIVTYSLTDHAVRIIYIIHGSRDWPEGEWPAE